MNFLESIKHQLRGPLAWIEGDVLFVTSFFSIHRIPIKEITELRQTYVNTGKFDAAYSFDVKYNHKWYSLREPASLNAVQYSSRTPIFGNLYATPSVVSLELLRKLVEAHPVLEIPDHVRRYIATGDVSLLNSDS
jgi:hypothetical protein